MLFFHQLNSSAFAGNELHRKGYNNIDDLAFMMAGIYARREIELSTYMFGAKISADQTIRDMH